jgi:hypothetical protein
MTSKDILALSYENNFEGHYNNIHCRQLVLLQSGRTRRTANISDLLCVPIRFLISPDLLQLPPQTSSSKAGEIWRKWQLSFAYK